MLSENQLRKSGIILVLAFSLSVAGWFAIRSRAPTTAVHFIIPEDFRGRFKVMYSVDGNEAQLENGKHIYRVPDTGVLSTKTTKPLTVWHQQTAEYESGVAIPVEPIGNNSSTLALYNLTTTSQQEHWFVIGTHDDYMAAYRQPTYEWSVGGVHR